MGSNSGTIVCMTPAVRLLIQRGIPHEVAAYDHDPASESYGLEAADALNLDPKMVFKTLLVSIETGPNKRSEHVVAVLPITHKLDLKALAVHATAKRALMADPMVAQRMTGYVVGGISPLGQKSSLRTFVDSSALDHPQVNVSGGRRGLEITIAPRHLIELLSANVCRLGA